MQEFMKYLVIGAVILGNCYVSSYATHDEDEDQHQESSSSDSSED